MRVVKRDGQTFRGQREGSARDEVLVWQTRLARGEFGYVEQVTHPVSQVGVIN
jgi:hypothetical protein